MFAGKRILVTGGAGFIGSHLTERLVALGAHVATLDHAPSVGLHNLASVRDQIQSLDFDLVAGDAKNMLERGGFEFIFHLAASAQVEASIENPRRDLECNAVATLHLLEGVRRVSPQPAIIYASSAVVYPGGGQERIKEEDPTAPTTPYGVSKLAAERYVSVYARLFGVRSAVLRLFSVYGPRLRKQIVFDLMRKLHADPERLVLHGDGTQSRDLTYVADVVEAFLVVAANGAFNGEAYNVASGHHVTTGALAESVAKAMGVRPSVSFAGTVTSGDTKHWFADTTRLTKLGYAPSIELEEGVRRTVAWFLSEADRAEPSESYGRGTDPA